MMVLNLLLVPLIVSLVVLGLMWSSKLQGYGNFMALKDVSPELHDFIRYSAAGLISILVFVYLKVEAVSWTWEWPAVLASAFVATYVGEKFGTGWISGAVVSWDANDYWNDEEYDEWMKLPVFKQIIRILPKNMFGVFIVAMLRGLLWGIWFAPIGYFIDVKFYLLVWAWVTALPAAHAIGAAFQHSLTPEYGSWGRKEDLRWLLFTLIAINL